MQDHFQVAHKTSSEATGANTHWLSGQVSITYQSEYMIAQLAIPHAGDSKEVVACPICGEGAFQVERERALFTTWRECDPPLQDWILAEFEKRREGDPSDFIAIVVLIAALGAMAWTSWGFWGTAQSEGWEAVLYSDPGAIIIFVLAAVFGFVCLSVLLSGMDEQENRTMDDDATFYITEDTGAPIANHSETRGHILTFGLIDEFVKIGTPDDPIHRVYQPEADDAFRHQVSIWHLYETVGGRPDWEFR